MTADSQAPAGARSVAGAASRAALKKAGDHPIATDGGGRTRSGTDLLLRIGRATGALARQGYGGGRIGLWFGNSLPALEAHLAVEWLGGTRVPVDPAAPAAEAQAVFKAAEVHVVVADGAHAAMLGGDVLVHDEGQPLEDSPLPQPLLVDPTQIHLLYPRMVASGTLFAIPVSFANWDATMRTNIALYRSGRYGPPVTAGDKFLTVQQLLHGTGFLGTFPFLLMNLEQVILPQFDAAAVLDAIQKHRITSTFMVPGMVTRLADQIVAESSEPPSSLRHLLYGGAPISVDEIRRSVKALGPHLVQVFGRVEGGWPIAVLDQADHQRILAGDVELGASFGRPIDEVETLLRQVEGINHGQGELNVRSAMVVSAYADPQGWCALGDVVSQAPSGYLRYVRRLDGMINTGSYHVYPGEVEACIRLFPGVRDARVVGETDPKWGQRVVAYVVHEYGSRESLPSDLETDLSARLAKYKIPKAIRIVDRLPDLDRVDTMAELR